MKVLTEYRIIKSQCPLWEECTHNVRYFPAWGAKLSRQALIPQPVKNFIRYIGNSPIIIAIRLFRNRRDYDIVITGDFKVGIFYAAFSRLFASHSCPHLLLDLMLDAERQSPLWRIKRFIQKKILAEVDCMLVFSQNELEYYPKVLNIDKAKFRFMPYHTNITQPQMISENSGYLFSAGKSGRDYKTLIEAVSELPVELIVVSDRVSMQGIKVPPNVKVYYDVSYDNYLELLKNSMIVVLPLSPHIRSLGMVVMLEAMALGKPTINSRAISNVEFINDGENGLLVEMENVGALRKKILYLLDNPEECSRIGQNALADVKKYWSFEKYVHSVLDIAQELTN